jgi:hypothetical protein
MAFQGSDFENSGTRWKLGIDGVEGELGRLWVASGVAVESGAVVY